MCSQVINSETDVPLRKRGMEIALRLAGHNSLLEERVSHWMVQGT